jgi:hypothetical protein
MADLTQSSATTATTTPEYYTKYMTDLATQGGAAAPNYVGAQPLQTQAYNAAQTNVGNYQSGLDAAGNLINKGAAVDITGAANPYLKSGTTTSGFAQTDPYLKAGTTTSGFATADPYLKSGTTTSGFATADPYLKSGTTTSGLSSANPYLTSGTSSAADLVGGYMNPYTQNVVDQIRMANQQNIAQNLSPGITAGAVGAGQFGSQRGANALALGISNANIGALNQQASALQSGYAQALAAAQAQRAAQLTAGQTAGNLQTSQNQNLINAGQIGGNLQNTANQNLINAGQIGGNLQNTVNQNLVNAGQIAGSVQNQGNVNLINAGQIAGNMATQEAQKNRDLAAQQMSLANQQQSQGIADVNQLATMGAQQQQIAQNKELFPLDVLNKKASIFSGAQLPTSTTSTMTGSPLSMIAGLGALGAAAFAPGAGVTITNPDGTKTTTPGLSYADRLINWIKSGQQGPAPTAYPDRGTGGGTGGGGAASDTIASDGKGGFIDTTTGHPANADGTPIPGHYETQYDENNDPVQVWVLD